MRKIITLSAGLSIVLTLYACQQEKTTKPVTPRPVKSVVLGDTRSNVIRHFPGKVLPSKSADLSFEVAGKLVSLPIKKGESVDKGQLLAQLDQKPFEDTQQQMQARYDLNKSQYLRGKELVKNNFISRSEYDKLYSNYKISEANLNTAKRNLKDSTLLAPFTGIVADSYVENHEQIKAKETLMSLHDITELDIEIHVPEKFMQKLKQKENDGDSKDLFVKFDAFPQKKFNVDFKEFSSQSDPDTQTYAVVFMMKQPKSINVLPGMSVTISARMSNKNINQSDYYILPISAVFSEDKQQSYVWLINPTKLTVYKQAVKTGMMQDSNIEVTEGLKPGQRVVIAGVHQLRDNQLVTLSNGKQND
jgi:RND family efflux transporter MFP subunit